MALAPPDRRDHPRVVLLTPGPHNETYFEHAYLARYLGFTLVEGGDLTVRDSRVFIKTLDGLQPVDVILRRLDDSFCDPLELRGDSPLGVAGLVEAVRAGNVTIANALGSGLVETPAHGRVPARLVPPPARRGAASVVGATWWCGHPDELQYVLEHLDELVIKRAFPPTARQPVFGRTLSAEQKQPARGRRCGRGPRSSSRRRRWRCRRRRSGTAHGSEAAPARAARLRGRRPAIRIAVMPGGLTRVGAAQHDVPIVVDAARRRQQGHVGRCRKGR